jgi:hypothetical protein
MNLSYRPPVSPFPTGIALPPACAPLYTFSTPHNFDYVFLRMNAKPHPLSPKKAQKKPRPLQGSRGFPDLANQDQGVT